MAVSDVLALTVPALLAGVGLCGVLTGTDVFSALTDGARDGLKTVMRIFPALVALLTAVSMLRASGALEALTRLCAPILARLGIPPETAMLLLVRPISGSGALAAASDIIQTYGAIPASGAPPPSCSAQPRRRSTCWRSISAHAACGTAAGRSPPPSPPT